MLYLKLLKSQIFPDSCALGSKFGATFSIKSCRDIIVIRIGDRIDL